MWAWDLPSHTYEWSDGMYDLFGLDPSEGGPSGEMLRRSIHPADWADIFAPHRADRVKDNFDKKVRALLPDGRQRWVRIMGRFFHAPDGEPLRASGFAIDETAIHSGRDEISYLRALLQAVQNVLPMTIWRAGADGGPVADHATWVHIGQGKLFAAGQALERVHPTARTSLEEKWQEAIRTQQPCHASFPVSDGASGWKIVTASTVPLWTADNRHFGWVGFHTDAQLSGAGERNAIDSEKLNSAQIRAARALLGWTLTDLSARAGIGFSTAQRLEDKGVDAAHARTVRAVREVLEEAGVRFVSTGEGHHGVVLTQTEAQPKTALQSR